MAGPIVAVVGSCNTDLTVFADELPSPGETVIGSDFVMAGGGKGANQAVAAARAGAEVRFVARLGDDYFSRMRLSDLQREGIMEDFIGVDHGIPGGVALITVDSTGENAITVAPGANAHLTPCQVMDSREALETADILLTQLEIPAESVEKALQVAAEAGVRTVLDPAPALSGKAAGRIFSRTEFLTPNLTEAKRLLGRRDRVRPEELTQSLVATGVGTVILTLGGGGACIATPDGCDRVKATPARAVDSVGAGDCFAGTLAVALAEGRSVRTAVEFAGAAASVSVERKGAQPSLPKRSEIEQRMEQSANGTRT